MAKVAGTVAGTFDCLLVIGVVNIFRRRLAVAKHGFLNLTESG